MRDSISNTVSSSPSITDEHNDKDNVSEWSASLSGFFQSMAYIPSIASALPHAQARDE